MREFVVEQYMGADASPSSATRSLRDGAEQLTREGTPVEYVRSIFIPEDETCIHQCRADSIEAVRAAAARASLRIDRVAEAVTES